MATKSWLPALPQAPLNQRPFMRKKLALIGASAQDHAERPPLGDPAWDVWGCNALWRQHLDRDGLFRADAWWEMHPVAVQTAQELQDMKDCPVLLWVLGGTQSLPFPPKHWTEYPLEAVRNKFGSRDYFTNTFAYQVALAIMMGYKEIGLWGIELHHGSVRERRVELPCLAYWLGMAQGRGVKIVLPEYSQLLWHAQLYGYDYAEDVAQSAEDDKALAILWCQEEAKRRKRQDGTCVSMGEMLQ